MEQVQTGEKQQSTTELVSFRLYVDIALIFGGIPVLVLNIILWAVATAFPALSVFLTLLITLLLAFTAIVLLVRYIDICILNIRKSNANSSDDAGLYSGIGAGLFSVFLGVCVIGNLSVAGSLEGWHYTLMLAEVLAIGYQTWRVLLSRE